MVGIGNIVVGIMEGDVCMVEVVVGIWLGIC